MREHATARKVALVTGANKGIGRAVAEQLATLDMTVLIGQRHVAAPAAITGASHRQRQQPHRVAHPHQRSGRPVRRAAAFGRVLAKTALSALTVQYANELRKDGILVNAVARATSTRTATTRPASSPRRRAPQS